MVGWVSFSWMAILSGRFSRVPYWFRWLLRISATEAALKEILLAQAEDLALDVVVVGVQHLGDQLGGGRSWLMAVL